MDSLHMDQIYMIAIVACILFLLGLFVCVYQCMDGLCSILTCRCCRRCLT